MLGDRQFAACPQQGPQVLIVHSHASESYTMPPGQEYVPSGTFRTADRSCNMVRVGDELAAELSSYGISVVHDRTLHDGESYNNAYENSLRLSRATWPSTPPSSMCWTCTGTRCRTPTAPSISW